jgi:molybdenum cofactor synthesis domain-containing protein
MWPVKVISVHEAEGAVLCHDITEIVPGRFKGRAFKKGHVVRKEDIPRLLDLGKEHLYAWEVGAWSLHENDAATRIASAVAGGGLELTEPVEGKVKLKARARGLLKIDVDALDAINGIDQICVATVHGNQLVEQGQTVAGCRVVPLVIDVAAVERAESLCGAAAPVIDVAPLRSLRVGVVTTGSEVFRGRIEDKFGPVIRAKVAALGSHVTRQILVPDDTTQIVAAIHALLAEGAELILVTGGMSVDPDDLTPAAIRAAGGRVEVYGAPVLPGSMFMLAHIGRVPVCGLPGCVMYHRTTIADLLLPRILAGEEVSRSEIARLGHGGLCLECKPCRHPSCAFGKGH